MNLYYLHFNHVPWPKEKRYHSIDIASIVTRHLLVSVTIVATSAETLLVKK